MNWKRICLVLLTPLFVACGLLPQLEDSYDLTTLTPGPTPTSEATATAVPGGGDGVGLAFFKAWEANDYLGMYSLLSPQSQALVDSGAFVRRYEEVMRTATVQTVRVQPQGAYQNGSHTQMAMRVTWETAVLGNIVRDHDVELIYNQDRWGVVWHEGLILPELANNNRLHMAYRIPARANIYDRDGGALAYQGTAITLGVVPGRISDEEALLAALSPLLNSTPEKLKARYATAQPDWFVPLGEISSETMQDRFAELQPFIDNGLTTENRLGRLYPSGGIAAHVIGFIGPIPAEEVGDYKSLGYAGDERVGRAGVERWGERYLGGTRGGTLTVVGPNGEYVTTIAESEPRQARSVYLTLERDFQAAVEQALAEALRNHPLGQYGSVVVLDVNSGSVLAMASYPTYNPLVFDPTRSEAGAELDQLFADPGRPFLNRVTQGEYPAGSVFKLVTFTAGLNSGIFTPGSRYNSTGSWRGLGDAYVKYDWREGGHGNISLAQALVVSCNSCFYQVGYEIDGVDNYLLPNTARQFGFGAPLGIQGVVESGGTIGDYDWKIANVGEGWATGDTVNMAIGQGYVQVTPLQIGHMMASIANDGIRLRPRLIDRIGAGGGAPEEQWPLETVGQLPLSAENLAIIQQSLRDVTSSGSGTATHIFQGLPVPVAGKTGTAETTPGNESHAWFAGYAPAAPYTLADGTVVDAPQIAIAVMIEHAGEGSAVAAPIFRRIVELYYGITPLTPLPWGG